MFNYYNYTRIYMFMYMFRVSKMILSQEKLKNRAAMMKKFMKIAIVSVYGVYYIRVYYTLIIHTVILKKNFFWAGKLFFYRMDIYNNKKF